MSSLPNNMKGNGRQFFHLTTPNKNLVCRGMLVEEEKPISSNKPELISSHLVQFSSDPRFAGVAIATAPLHAMRSCRWGGTVQCAMLWQFYHDDDDDYIPEF